VSQLGDFIEAERERIVQRWADQLYATTAPTSLNREDVIDSAREMLDELVTALRGEDGFHQHSQTAMASAIAKGHGGQRFALGYEITAMIREYGTLRDVLYQMIEEFNLSPGVREFRVLSKYITGSIADAASQHALERDEELKKQAAKHMGFLAHELRNPLASARLALSMLERKGLLPQSRSIEVIGRSLQRANDLLDNALLEIRLRAIPEPQREPVALAELFRELTEESGVDLEIKGLQVKIEAPAELSLNADRKLLHSALSNLVRNAVKFSREGGTISLRARDGGTKRIAMDVEDECGGLPEGRLQSLFDPFVQVGKDRSGFGLGLAIAKQAAEAHGGELRVHNLPGKGCVFVLDIPTDPSPPLGK
jgi:hypothetical protein